MTLRKRHRWKETRRNILGQNLTDRCAHLVYIFEPWLILTAYIQIKANSMYNQRTIYLSLGYLEKGSTLSRLGASNPTIGTINWSNKKILLCTYTRPYHLGGSGPLIKYIFSADIKKIDGQGSLFVVSRISVKELIQLSFVINCWPVKAYIKW